MRSWRLFVGFAIVAVLAFVAGLATANTIVENDIRAFTVLMSQNADGSARLEGRAIVLDTLGKDINTDVVPDYWSNLTGGQQRQVANCYWMLRQLMLTRHNLPTATPTP